MSLVTFQTWLARLTASPELVRAVRADPDLLDDPDLSKLERTRLARIAGSEGMRANCMIYRANRLAPLALNCPETLEALGDALETLLAEFWASEPETHVNFLMETDRFCCWLAARPEAPASLAAEHAQVAARLEATLGLAGRSAWLPA
ncbi:MAG: hypothetical protein ACK4MX_07290 [Thermaurantiacus sp.]